MSARTIPAPEQNVAILREYLIEKMPLSQVGDKHMRVSSTSTIGKNRFLRTEQLP